MENNVVSVRALLALMDPDERVKVYSCSPIWCSDVDFLKTAGDHLESCESGVLDRSVACVRRCVFGYIALDLED